MNLLIEMNQADVDWQQLRFSNRNRCPKCSSLIYSRKSHSCGICGVQLPESARLRENERVRLSEMLQSERQRHRQWLSRREPEGYLRLSLS